VVCSSLEWFHCTNKTLLVVTHLFDVEWSPTYSCCNEYSIYPCSCCRPAEVLCLSGHHRFITTPPPTREPFYTEEEHIISPKIRSPDGIGTTVYSNMPGPHAHFTMARAGPSRGLKPHPPRGADDIALSFESRFESGNLAKAIQVGRWDYELLLRPDLYTGKHTQWYFFSVGNMRARQLYRFTILNFYKVIAIVTSSR